MIVTAKVLSIPAEIQTVFSVIWMLNHMQGFIKFIPNTILKFNSAAACIRRLKRFLDLPDFTENFLDAYPFDDLPVEVLNDLKPERIILDQVSVFYGNDCVLKNISAQFNLNEATSIIGKVGSGKTTLIRVLMGEIKPQKGKVMVRFKGGITADLWHRNIHETIRAFTGYVGQEPYLSNATLAGNISLDETADEKKVMQDIYFASLQADIETFEKGIHQEIGENGINLSGGQKQRVNLARGFYSSREFLILDDPLSAVDSETESIVMDSIFENTKHFILVSHRLDELRRTDRLIALKEGEIVEDGDPKVLHTRDDSYYKRQLLRNGENKNKDA